MTIDMLNDTTAFNATMISASDDHSIRTKFNMIPNANTPSTINKLTGN